MNLSFFIAKRYLFSKKSHNAINFISMLSVGGIAVATMAMVCALSIFNGFTEMAAKTFSHFDPDLEISVVRGKVFDPTDDHIRKALNVEGIEFTSECLEENALLRYEERQIPVTLKGVSENFDSINGIQKTIISGEYGLRMGDFDYAVLGVGLASKIGVRASSLYPLEIYMPKRNERVNMANPTTAFVEREAYVSGLFALNQAEYDEQIMLVSIDLIREMLRYEKEVSTINIKVREGASVDAVQAEIQKSLGSDFVVKNRFEQQESTYRMVNIEKWVTYLILVIILTIAIFNVVSSLSMLIIEKEDDIRILQNMGADKQLISKTFLFEGWLITFFGAMVGLVVGLVLCLLQQHFGLLKLGTTPGAFIVDAYPVVVEAMDIFVVFLTVSIVGLLAVLYPINTLRKRL